MILSQNSSDFSVKNPAAYLSSLLSSRHYLNPANPHYYELLPHLTDMTPTAITRLAVGRRAKDGGDYE